MRFAALRTYFAANWISTEMKLCFQFDLWRPSPCHLEPAGTVKHQCALGMQERSRKLG